LQQRVTPKLSILHHIPTPKRAYNPSLLAFAIAQNNRRIS
jgi:hypothetical protein